MATPTSAKTASHMEANPPAPRVNTINLTEKANVIFCQTICLVFLPMLIAVAIFVGWSF